MNEYVVTTLHQVKLFLGIDDSETTDDEALEILIEEATSEVEGGDILNRKVRARTHTEYHDGDGSSRLFVNSPPIISVTSLHDDAARDFTATTLIAATDYSIEGNAGAEGYIQLLDGLILNAADLNVKAVYVGGFDEFIISSGVNDKIDFYDSDGGNEITATLTAGTYLAADLATHIGTVMTTASAGEAGDTQSSSYNPGTGRFTIATDGAYLVIRWLNGTNTATNAARILGYDKTADDSGDTSHTADFARLGIPRKIQTWATIWVAFLYKQSGASGGGGGRLGKKSENISVPGRGTLFESLDDMRMRMQKALNSLRITNV